MQRASARAAARALAAACALSLLCWAGGVQPNCDRTQDVPVGKTYYIYNEEYPSNYTPGSNCRWRATAPAGARLKLSCSIDIPKTSNCYLDRIRISLSGDDWLNDAHQYCGNGNFSVMSDDNKLTMVLETSYSSPGGLLLCSITSVTSSCLCGIKKETRIVGGQETGVNEFPFMAGLIDASIREIFCGATIVSQHYAVTAAHCQLNRNLADIGLLVGDHDISTGDDTSATKLYRLAAFIVHPYYNKNPPVDQDNDIALVRVQGAIAMSREVMPACLPFRYWDYDFTRQKVEVVGWGTTDFGGALSNVLRKADLEVQSPTQCSAVYGNTVSMRQMCSYNPGKDACQADSGGPLFWQDSETGRVHIVGIVSHGVSCATTSPGINTRVTAFLNWITYVIGSEDTYCTV